MRSASVRDPLEVQCRRCCSIRLDLDVRSWPAGSAHRCERRVKNRLRPVVVVASVSTKPNANPRIVIVMAALKRSWLKTRRRRRRERETEREGEDRHSHRRIQKILAP